MSAAVKAVQGAMSGMSDAEEVVSQQRPQSCYTRPSMSALKLRAGFEDE